MSNPFCIHCFNPSVLCNIIRTLLIQLEGISVAVLPFITNLTGKTGNSSFYSLSGEYATNTLGID